MKAKSIALFLFFTLAFLIPLDLRASGTPVTIQADSIKDIEVDATMGYIYFRAGNQNLFWYSPGETHDRIRTAVLVAGQLRICEQIEVTWSRNQTTRRDGDAYDFATSLIIKIPSPKK